MAKIYPVDDEVTWPDSEGVLGIVGVAPWATLDFLQIFYGLLQTSKDWHFPRVICDINTKIPSRGRHLELGERDPSPFILQSIHDLAAQGATIAVVPCNTAHILYSQWAPQATIPVVSIIDATVNEIRKNGARKVAVFSSGAVANYNVYNNKLHEHGFLIEHLTDKQQQIVSQAITEMKINGFIQPQTISAIHIILNELKNFEVDSVIIGCTELKSLVGPCAEYFPTVAESNSAMAKQVLSLMNLPESIFSTKCLDLL